MPESSDKKVSVTPKEFWKVTLWAVKLLFQISTKFSVIYIFLAIANKFFLIANTLLLAKIIDALVTDLQNKTVSLPQLYNLIAILFGLNLLERIMTSFRSWSRNHLFMGSQRDIQRRFYIKINQLGVSTIEQPEVSNRINRTGEYMGGITQYVIAIVEAIATFVQVVSLLWIIGSFIPWAIPILVISVLPVTFADSRYTKMLYSFNNSTTEDMRKSNWTSGALQNPRELQEISVTGAFKFMDNKVFKFITWYRQQWLAILTKWTIATQSLGALSDIVVLGISAKVILDGATGIISVGTTMYRYRIIGQVKDQLEKLLTSFSDLLEGAVKLYDVYYIFNLEPFIKDGQTEIQKLEKGPEIEFRNVTFNYPNSEKNIFTDLNLKIESGEKIAIVGPNGAGKTTLVNMICRFYSLQRGAIYINGLNLSDLKISSWYKNIGILFQNYNAYPQMTVKENILIGNADEPVDEEKIKLAAKFADAQGFIEKFKNKYDQVLGERFKDGIRPSTGQWQKIAIARFFYRNAPLVIFDEPTASIDAVSEFNIFNKIYEFFTGKTVIIISHRFSTVRNADRILVINEGKIVEQGNHKELMALNGEYAKAFLLQAQGYTDKIYE